MVPEGGTYFVCDFTIQILYVDSSYKFSLLQLILHWNMSMHYIYLQFKSRDSSSAPGWSIGQQLSTHDGARARVGSSPRCPSADVPAPRAGRAPDPRGTHADHFWTGVQKCRFCLMQGISSTYSTGTLRILLNSDSQFRIIGNSLSDTLSCTSRYRYPGNWELKYPSRQSCESVLRWSASRSR